MSLPKRDGDGYLLDMSEWSIDVMFAMALEDDYELTEEKVNHIMKAREIYEDTSAVPAIRNLLRLLVWTRKTSLRCG